MTGAPRQFTLAEVAFFGRTMDEYLRVFGLTPADIRGKRVLDCPGGPDSFTAEANAIGCNVIAVDPMYAQTADALEAQAKFDVAHCMAQMRATADLFPALNIDQYEIDKKTALQRFIADYRANRDRYIAGSLPTLPFADRSFDLVLSAHLLFVYSPVEEDGFLQSKNLDLPWHQRAVAELIRVSADELRLYPTVAVNSGPQPRRHRYIAPIIAALSEQGCACSYVPSTYQQISSELNDSLLARRLA